LEISNLLQKKYVEWHHDHWLGSGLIKFKAPITVSMWPEKLNGALMMSDVKIA